MAQLMKHISLFLLLIISEVYCCYFTTYNSRQVCNSLVSISIEGNDTWSNVYVTNHKPVPFAIRANSFKRVPNLRELSVSNVNEIELNSFAELTKLNKISIYNSFIDNVSKEVFDNLPIRDIQLLNCSIENLVPDFFKNIPDIRIVDFRDNLMTVVKAGVFSNAPIYRLYLDSNRIETIEDNAFINMAILYHISLSENRLTNFDSLRVLGTSNSLQSMWLNRNKITKFTKKIVEGTPNLENIYIEINMIDDIEDGAFEIVPMINFIDLSNNYLTELRPKMFAAGGAKKLSYFFLHNNRLTFINKALFLRTPNVTYITYGGNPFQCPCLDNIKSWTANMTRLCDDFYYNGERPGCVSSELSETECLYDVDLTKDVYETYTAALADYPKLQLKCDTSSGVEHAALLNKT